MSARRIAVADGNAHPLHVAPSSLPDLPSNHEAPSNFIVVEYPIYDPILLRESDVSYVVVYEIRLGFRRLVSIVCMNTKTSH